MFCFIKYYLYMYNPYNFFTKEKYLISKFKIPLFLETIEQHIPSSKYFRVPWRLNRLIGKRERRIGLKNKTDP